MFPLPKVRPYRQGMHLPDPQVSSLPRDAPQQAMSAKERKERGSKDQVCQLFGGTPGVQQSLQKAQGGGSIPHRKNARDTARVCQGSHTPISNGARGLITLVHRSIPARQVDLSCNLGNHVELLSIEVYFDNKKYHSHNIHRKYRIETFCLSPILKDPISSIIMGDFNAHNTTTAGRNLATDIDKYPYIIFNDKVRTHSGGSALDLAVFHVSLAPQAHFSIHNSFFSDHLAIQVLLYIDKHPLPTVFTPHWNLSKADWKQYSLKLSEVSNLDVCPFSIEVEQLLFMINLAAEHAIPKTRPYKFRKSHWYTNDELRKAKRKANKALRKYRRLPNFNNKNALQEASHNLRSVAFKCKNDSWRKWVDQLNGHTQTRVFWKRISCVKASPRRPDIHHNPSFKANEFVEDFAQRTSVTNLPLHTQQDLDTHFQHRQDIINQAIHRPSSSNVPFTMQELDVALIRSRGTAPVEDCITYTMLSKAPIEIRDIMLRLYNKSFSLDRLPATWKSHGNPHFKQINALCQTLKQAQHGF